MRWNVLFCGTGWPDIVPRVQAALDARGVEATVSARDLHRPLTDQLHEVDVALPSNAQFGVEELAAAPRLRLLQQPAVGYEGIDVGAARARRIPVCNAPGTNTDAVAQASLLLILALARRLPEAQREFGQRHIGAPLGLELTGRTLGIVGMGAIGGRVAHAAKAFGMTCRGVRSGDGRAGFLAMLREADVLAVHCPLTPATRGMFDDEAFAAMKPGALLVNLARGAILDRGATERALAHGTLGGLGLDVFWDEPWNPDDALFAHPRVVTLPHIAGSTVEAFDRIAAVVAHNIDAVRHDGTLRHRVDNGDAGSSP